MNFLKHLFAGMLTVSTLAFGMSMMPAPAMAQNPLQQAQQNLDAASGGVGGGPGSQQRSLTQIISSVIDIALGLLGILLFLYFFYGGFLWMTAGGDSKQIDAAKTQIKNATIGLLIILASWSISRFVLQQLVQATTGTTLTN